MLNKKLIPTALFLVGTFFGILLSSFSSAWANAARDTDEHKVHNLIEAKMHTILSILDNNEIEKAEKNKNILVEVEGLIDFGLMAKLSLGKKNWRILNEDQKEAYLSLFVEKIKNLYLGVLHTSVIKKITLDEPSRIKKNRIIVPMHIVDDNKRIEVIYKFYLTKSGDWLVYDLETEGVSLIKIQHAQFAEFLKNSSIDQLIERLRQDRKK